MIRPFLLFLTLSFLWGCASLTAAVSYKVEFEGIPKKGELLETLRSASHLISLQNRPPDTTAALKRRANNDLPNLVKALHSLAYYNAKVTVDVSIEEDPALVIVRIDAGQVYPLASFQVVPADPDADYPFVCPSFPLDSISPNFLGISLGAPAYPRAIIQAEEKLLTYLATNGYPLSSVAKREVVADQNSKEISVTLHVLIGPLSRFGNTKITGVQSVCLPFFHRKILWKRGEIFNPCKIEQTQNALEESGLFQSISIDVSGAVSSDGELPLVIDVKEGKHRSVGGGFGFTTQLGPGFTLEWEHRNMSGMGEKISLEGTWWQKLQEGKLLYRKPDFLMKEQDLIWSMQARHERTRGFIDYSVGLSGMLERRLSDYSFFSYGGMFKQLLDREKEDNQSNEFSLLKVPVKLHWSCSNNPLNPTQGASFVFKVEPTYQMLKTRFFYLTETINIALYQPITRDHRFALAFKMQIGSIFAAKRSSIPPSERFYAGSGTTLRGYNYLTVSPLAEKIEVETKTNDEGEEITVEKITRVPVGGRSIMVYNLELRTRWTKKFGTVYFYDFGNVYEEPLPQITQKILHSVGTGIRYFTPIGPLRLDIAFPLNPRKGIDKRWQAYLSIGQAF